MALSRPGTYFGKMNLDISQQINAQDTLYRQDSSDSLPELETLVSRYLVPKNDKKDTLNRGRQTRNMDLDDLNEDHGGVSLTAEPNSIHLQSSHNGPTDIGTQPTDLSSPHSKESPPSVWTEYQSLALKEEPSRDMDDDDDDSMPDLEDVGGAPIFPPNPPAPSIGTNANNTSPTLGNTYHPDPRINTTSLPIPSNESRTVIDTAPHCPTPTTSSTSPERPERPPIKISWFVWAPEDPSERDLCERVCEQVAHLHGFQKVIIKSRIITHHIKQTWSTTRHIYIEPFLTATFYSHEFSPHKRRWEKIAQNADVHVGPDWEEDWTKWGLWRKEGREAVVWRD